MTESTVTEQTDVEAGDAPPPEGAPAPEDGRDPIVVKEEAPGVFEGLDQHPDTDAPPADPPAEGGEAKDEAPAAPPAPEVSTVNAIEVVKLYDLRIPLARFPRPEALVGERADDDLVGQVEACGGLLQPVIISTTGDEKADSPIDNAQIVDGRRRLQALWRLNERDSGKDKRWSVVPTRLVAVPKEGADVRTTLLTLVSHATRRDNDAVTYAAVFKLTQTGADGKQIVASTGMSQQTIQRIQRLSRLIPQFLTAMYEGRISGWVASKLSALSEADQVFLFTEKLEKNGKLVTKEIDDLRRAQRRAASDETLDEVDKRLKEQEDAPPTEGDDDQPTAYRDLLAERDALKETVEGLRVELERREADYTRVLTEVRSMVDEKAARITDLEKMLGDMEVDLHAAKMSTGDGNADAQLEAAFGNIDRLEREVKLFKNDAARRAKKSLPYPELAKERIEDDD